MSEKEKKPDRIKQIAGALVAVGTALGAVGYVLLGEEPPECPPCPEVTVECADEALLPAKEAPTVEEG